MNESTIDKKRISKGRCYYLIHVATRTIRYYRWNCNIHMSYFPFSITNHINRVYNCTMQEGKFCRKEMSA